MRSPLLRLRIILAAAAASGLTACATYDGYGGHGGLSVGFGTGYYDPWYDPYYRSYYRPYWGWYDGLYYPGAGTYIYDRFRRPFFWSDRHRRYWAERRDDWRARTGTRESSALTIRDNWRDFRRARQQDRRAVRIERRNQPSAFRSTMIGREQVRSIRPTERPSLRAQQRRETGRVVLD